MFFKPCLAYSVCVFFLALLGTDQLKIDEVVESKQFDATSERKFVIIGYNCCCTDCNVLFWGCFCLCVCVCFKKETKYVLILAVIWLFTNQFLKLL